MKHFLFSALLIFLPFMVEAEDYTKEDFAFGYILETDNQGAMYSVTLPHDIYTGTVVGTLEDVRVFNSEGQVVPHEIRYPAVVDKKPMTKKSVPFFPLFLQQDQNDIQSSMSIEIGISGEFVHIQKSSVDSEQIPTAYLIDMGNIDNYPLSLNFQWISEGTGSLFPVILESSEDLVSWRKIKQSTLADLLFMNNRLRHGEIEVQQEPGRYLRLKSQNRIVLPEITAIQTVSRPKSSVVDRRWIQLSCNLHQKDNKTYLESDIPGKIPIDGLRIEFNQPNSLLKSRLLWLDNRSTWHYKTEGLFYLLTNNGIELRSEPLSFPRQYTSAIRLEVVEDGVGRALETIKVKVGYVPQEIFFIARGQGPFTLAYGHGKMVSDTQRSSRSLLRDIPINGQQNLLRKAEIKEKVVLGGEMQLHVPHQKPWRKIVLWLVLIAGVVTLAVMAWALAGKMNTV